MAEEKTDKKLEEKEEEIKEEKTAGAAKEEAKEKAVEEKKEEKTEAKKPSETKKMPKSEAVVNSYNARLSMKISRDVCRFIMKKPISKAVSDLEQVALMKKAVPMRGEIPHRKGKIMSGRFPKKTAEHFITLLKALAANASVNGIDDPVIAEAVANIGNRPFGKFGAVRRKRAHIKIIAKSNSALKSKGSKGKKNSKNKTRTAKKQKTKKE